MIDGTKYRATNTTTMKCAMASPTTQYYHFQLPGCFSAISDLILQHN